MEQAVDVMWMSMQSLAVQAGIWLPKVIMALALVLAGWLLARVMRGASQRLLEALGFEKIAQRTGLEALLRQGGVDISLAGIIAALAYWTVQMAVWLTAANLLGLDRVAELFQRVIFYLPNVLTAMLVLMFGTLMARFLNRLVFAWLHGMKAPSALVISTATEYGVQVFALFLALEQLAISTQLLSLAFSIGFGGLVLALALAFGLGGRDVARDLIVRGLKAGTDKGQLS